MMWSVYLPQTEKPDEKFHIIFPLGTDRGLHVVPLLSDGVSCKRLRFQAGVKIPFNRSQYRKDQQT